MTKKPIKFTEDMVGNVVGKTAPIGGSYEIVKVSKPKRKAHRHVWFWSWTRWECDVCGKQKPESVRK